MLYGRDLERDHLARLLEGARASQSGALVLRGEPGVGKTALLEQARTMAAGMHVLRSRGVESESELPFAGLHQLIRPALHLCDRLPAAQAAAMEGVGLAERGGDDRFLISVACLSLFSELAEERPVLVLVDDAQWLDMSSADALLFVARRLHAEGIVILFASREGPGHRRFDARSLPELEVPGLSPDAAAQLIMGEVEGVVAPAVRDLLVKQSSGNALALVELPGALSARQLAGLDGVPEEIPLTPNVERLFLERVRRLPETTQKALALVATEDSGVARAGAARDGRGRDRRRRPEGGRGGGAGDRARPARRDAPSPRPVGDPPGAVVGRAPRGAPRARRGPRRRPGSGPARVAPGRRGGRARRGRGRRPRVDRRARTASQRARRGGGGAERAAELSPATEARARRLVLASAAAWHAGQPERATALLDRADPLVTDGRLRADVEHLRGEIQLRCGSLIDACDILMAGASSAAALDTHKALEMLLHAREAAGWAGDTPRTLDSGRRAAMLPRSEDPETRLLGDLLVGVGRMYDGEAAIGTPLVQEVVAHADEFDEPSWVVWTATGAQAIGDEARAEALLRRAMGLARASGAVDKLTYALLTYVLMGLLGGRFDVAAEAAEGLTLARDAGLPNAASTHLAMHAWFAAQHGDEDECRTSAASAIEAARTSRGAFANAMAEWATGVLELSRRRPHEAVPHLQAVGDERPGKGHAYFALMSAPDLVEALVLAGSPTGPAPQRRSSRASPSRARRRGRWRWRRAARP